MSDNVDTAPTEGVETPAEAMQATEATEAPEAPEQPTEAAEEPKKQAEPPWFMKRIDAMNRRNADLARELAALKAQQQEPTHPEMPEMPQSLTEQAIQAEVDRRTAQNEFNAARAAVINGGVQEFGAETWNAKTQMIASMGATDNTAFMEALVELPDAHKLVAALADDPDRLVSLLNKRPQAMATAMGLMSAEMAIAAPKPRISNAPAPVKPIAARGAQAEADPAKMTTKEFIEYRNRTAPRHLGGARGRRA